jgi:thymidylate synthase (FAD)
MKVINPSFEVLSELKPSEILRNIEKYGRVCYKSEDKATSAFSSNFVERIIKSGHESVIEHEKITVKIICDRGVSHEIVRHRIASYSQESTRYCNYSQSRFGREITVIKPCFWKESSPEYLLWAETIQRIEDTYNRLIDGGAKPEEARSILPNSLKTEIVVTMNLREWRHFFKLRTSLGAHPQMREIAMPLLKYFKNVLPVVFNDISTQVAL